jgi:hypothetical protein
MELQDCACWDEQCQSGQFDTETVSARRSGSTVERIDAWTCRDCRNRWLRLSVEDEEHPGWSAWYRGLVTDEQVRSGADLSQEKAMELLGSMRWHYFGGAYYRSSGDRSAGAVPIARRQPALRAA